jgi:hypothetical protein
VATGYVSVGGVASIASLLGKQSQSIGRNATSNETCQIGMGENDDPGYAQLSKHARTTIIAKEEKQRVRGLIATGSDALHVLITREKLSSTK